VVDRTHTLLDSIEIDGDRRPQLRLLRRPRAGPARERPAAWL